MYQTPPHRERLVIDTSRTSDPDASARRSNRRRLMVFLIVFLTTLVPGLAWNQLRQRVRFSDLAAYAGQLDADQIAAFAALYSGSRLPQSSEIDPVMPAIRDFGTG